MIRNITLFTLFVIVFAISAFGQAPIITYNSPNTFNVNNTINILTPTTVGFGSGTIYSIHKPLPLGLKFDPKTGIINGTPLKVTSNDDYIVTATNGKDSSSFPIQIIVSPKLVVITSPPTIEFVGQGNIQPSLSNGVNIPATTGIGVIYSENLAEKFRWLHSIRLEFSLNVASTVDTIKSQNDAMNNVTNIRDFGNSILLPLNSGQAYSFNFTGYITKQGEDGSWYRNQKPEPVLYGIISGFQVSFVGSNRNWEYDSVYVDNNKNKAITPKLVKTSLISLYAGAFHEFIPFASRPSYSITIGLGYSGRFIAGDIAQTTESNLRNKLLGNTQNSFNGWEINLGLRFSNIKAEVRIPFMLKSGNIPGLSGVQPNTFIGFSGGFPIDLHPKSN